MTTIADPKAPRPPKPRPSRLTTRGNTELYGWVFTAHQLGGASAFQATLVVPEVATLPLLATAVLTAILSRERKRHVLP